MQVKISSDPASRHRGAGFQPIENKEFPDRSREGFFFVTIRLARPIGERCDT